MSTLGARNSSTYVADLTSNDQRPIAGTLRDDNYSLALELRRLTWRPNAPSALDVDVAAFAEVGESATVPGPLIRVPAGTHLRITIRNTLAERATVHGLHDHDGPRDSVSLTPGETRELRFVAQRVGTFAYFARTTATPTLLGRRDDSQLVAAFIVDPAGTDPGVANARERLLIITAWDDSLANPASPYGPRQVYAINGQSWPFTERLTYNQGDSIRWRVLNLSQHVHPMHLHGTYFRVQSRGTPFTDTALGDTSRLVVTEYLGAGGTMMVDWKAERAGNWLFHCHTINHIDEALRLGEVARANAHANHGTVTDVMAGLVTAISVRPSSVAEEPEVTPRRRLRLFVTERPAPVRGSPSLAYVLQRDEREPARDSVELPGSTLELQQDEPTVITVVNRSRQPTAVHWHGMELESFYDGVAGWSGGGTRVAPIIAPDDSFVVHMTPPRAGTFIYHTHAGELAQLTGGLYGAMIVRARDHRPDANERVVVLADSTADSIRAPVGSMINGRRNPVPIDLTAGRTHRIRFISIGAVALKRVRLLEGDAILQWIPVAKDGAEYTSAQRVRRSAEQVLAPGETMDVLVTPTRAGTLVLEVTSAYGPPVTTRVEVRVEEPR
ncbi:multicopper oxidase domain-containing protein [Pseudogemmatithrix spongiicola]|uniref:Multicopper oxidase domain-containing protein n=1 Tax=Pseudogemmatithrix spongiicola TaxID=3062599 RepID=A0AA49JZ99_9BACT|nr:multicopper oxidase domain-containing protein [Gemmatimonadaceae bacterium 'strain 318']